jgi:acetylornithine deacetylase/succinyl-diaminopimelate desuccinylase-like protein
MIRFGKGESNRLGVKMIGRVTWIAVALPLLFGSASLSAAQQGIRISTREQIKAEFDSVPCKNGERLKAVRALFEKMGAAASDIAVDKYKNVENLVIRKQGNSEEKIIVGAHYDKVADGCGAIDNWTGIVAIAHLYSSLKDVPLNKTILFVAFGKEETGLEGSHVPFAHAFQMPMPIPVRSSPKRFRR